MFKIMPMKINQKSMEPILFDGDYVLVTQKKKYNKGDIVVFRDKFDNKYKIKYIFAESNDWVDTNSVPPKIWIDNNNKNYLNKLTKLEHNTFYVLGYNVQMSKDSRHFGPIAYDQIIGKLIFRYYPFNSIRFF